MQLTTQSQLLAHWKYTNLEWNDFVDIEKANKKEDNLYFGVGIVIIGTLTLVFFRGTSILTGLLFSVPLAILIPLLRMKFSYKHLKKNVQNPQVKICSDYLEINEHKIDLYTSQKRVKNLKIIDATNNTNLLEFDIQWLTRKGPTNDEVRILIPSNKLEEAKSLVKKFKK